MPGLNATFNHNSTGFPLTGHAHGAAAAVHRLPRQQQLQPHQHDLRQLPPERLQQREEPGEPHRGGFPTTCEHCHDTVLLDGWQRSTTPPPVSADRVAHGAAAGLHRLPRQQQLQPEQHALRHLPPERLQQHDQSGARNGGFPTTCELCHDTTAGRIRPSITTTRRSR